MNGNKPMRIAATAGFVAMVVVNTLAVLLPINGVTPDEVSDRYETLFAPAGFTFSIWSVIYTLLAIYTVYQTFKSNEIVNAVAAPFFATSVINCAWIVSWHYDQILLSVLLMTALLVGLARIATILNQQNLTIRNGIGRYLLFRAPFSVYFGWICVALVANISAYLVSIGWRGTGFSEEVWLVLTLVVAAGIGLLTMISQRDLAFGLVFVWAFWGILAKHRSPEGWNNEYELAITTLLVLLAVLAAGVALSLWRDLRSSLPASSAA